MPMASRTTLGVPRLLALVLIFSAHVAVVAADDGEVQADDGEVQFKGTWDSFTCTRRVSLIAHLLIFYLHNVRI